MIEKYIAILKNLILKMRLGEDLSAIIAESVSTLSLLILSIGIFFLIKFILKKTVYKIIQLSTNKYDDLLIKNKVIGRMCLLIPALITGALLSRVLPDFPETAAFLTKAVNIFEIIICTMILSAFVSTGEDLYNMHEMSKIKPITGLVQVSKIVLYILTVLVIIAYVLGTKIGNVLISLGTMSAIIILVFQDTIKGFVGGIQLSVNDMLRIGDWIVVGPADGTVQEINLTTVKVQNWDNTISTIPTYNLVSNPFTNWRGMSESGGRRIARSVNIDVNTIRYCTPEMLEKYKQYSLVKDYITLREEDILEYNKANNIDTSQVLNGRQQTNLGIFRAYIKAYLNNNPKLNHNLTMMVRQLQPTEFGVPLQIYAFSSDKQWVNYEEIQSDIFDHIISAAPMFDLKIYQKH
ncbi:MAG: miniconductance mechanosensitive channel [bacterium F083]|nr:MAG: miniconductance mechanosensitive channel [bacterium P201]KWW38233.1 MAG: miniconductance mechanosensitive channel [bacterium F083]